jgi:hypothetical protein
VGVFWREVFTDALVGAVDFVEQILGQQVAIAQEDGVGGGEIPVLHAGSGEPGLAAGSVGGGGFALDGGDGLGQGVEVVEEDILDEGIQIDEVHGEGLLAEGDGGGEALEGDAGAAVAGEEC